MDLDHKDLILEGNAGRKRISDWRLPVSVKSQQEIWIAFFTGTKNGRKQYMKALPHRGKCSCSEEF